MFRPTDAEIARRNEVVGRVIEFTKADQRIRLPDFNGIDTGAEVALLGIFDQPNDFSGSIDAFQYQFEGEDDLLHLFVARADRQPIAVEHAQSIASFLLPSVPASLIWIKPGHLTQHFYLGHDLLLESIIEA